MTRDATGPVVPTLIYVLSHYTKKVQDGEKKWKDDDKVMPSFQGPLKVFVARDHVIHYCSRVQHQMRILEAILLMCEYK